MPAQRGRILRHSPFGSYDSVHSFLDFRHGQRREPEPCTSTLNSGGNLVHVITNDAETNVFGILLDDTSESCLGCLRHHVRFIEDDELVAL